MKLSRMGLLGVGMVVLVYLSGTSQALDKGMHVAPAPKPQTQSFWDFVLTLAGQNHWELGG